MTRTILLAAAISCFCFSPFRSEVSAADPIPEKPGWKLTFHDEFDGPMLDNLNWFPSYRVGLSEITHRNKKGAKWVSRNANYVLEDGVIKIRLDEQFPLRAKKDGFVCSSIQTSDFRFGKTMDQVQVLDKFAQKYGWFEIRSRMPEGSGLHSAFWLLHSDPNDQEIAPNGRRRKIGDGVVEIDIFEQLGNRTEKQLIDFNVHFTKDGHFRHELGFDPSKEFHVYAFEWNEGELIWYVDGKKAYTYKGETPQKPMFILLGLYQGSGWVGPMDPDMPYPRDFEVDYIRVYAREDAE